ncbi:MAG: DNA replication and repair protein RecF, partial [bacterium]
MRIKRIALTTFRNYKSLIFSPHPSFNYLFGCNGAGKTNLLEAIYFLLHLRSFRRASRMAMVAENEEGMRLRGDLVRDGGDGALTLEAVVQGDQRKYKVNGKEEGNLLSYLGRAYAAVFFPESLQVIKAGPALRRAFFDRAIAAEDPRHLEETREYNRLLGERNRLLREGKDFDIMDVWERRLIESAARIVARRHRYLASLRRQLLVLEQRLGGEMRRSLSVEYAAGWMRQSREYPELALAAEQAPSAGEKENPAAHESLEEEIRGLLKEEAVRKAAEDRRRGATQWGPHLDDFRILLGGRRARDTASQGEQRGLMIR